MGENICRWYDRQGISLQNLQTVHAAKYHQNKQPNQKRERTQINKIRNEKRITADITEVQRIIRDYYQPLCGNKMNILEEMNKFLERYSLPRPNQEETENNYEQTNPSTEIKTD